VFHISHWRCWSFVCGAKPGTGYQQPSISKTVLPNHARWDMGLLDAQQWLQSLSFDGNCVEQFYSVQALASCTTISINALFHKSFNYKSYLNISFALALGFQAKGLVQGRRNSGRAGRKYKSWGQCRLIKNKNRYQLCLFLFSKMLISKLITEIIENHSEVSGCTNSCNKFVSNRSW